MRLSRDISGSIDRVLNSIFDIFGEENGNINYDTGGGNSAPLDSLKDDMASAWSVGRLLLYDYNGALIRVRRSVDNAEQDFNPDSNGELLPSVVESFCGAGDGFLTKIYDQSGSLRDLVQSSTTIQPKIVNSGSAIKINNRLAAEFDGGISNRRLYVPSSTAIYKFLHDGSLATLYSVQTVQNNNDTKTLITNYTASTETGIRIVFTADEKYRILIRGTSPAIAIDVTKAETISTNLISTFINADAAVAAEREEVWVDTVISNNNNSLVGAVSSSNSTRNLYLGSTDIGTLSFDGKFGELVLWSADKTTNRSTWEISAKNFWGTP